MTWGVTSLTAMSRSQVCLLGYASQTHSLAELNGRPTRNLRQAICTNELCHGPQVGGLVRHDFAKGYLREVPKSTIDCPHCRHVLHWACRIVPTNIEEMGKARITAAQRDLFCKYCDENRATCCCSEKEKRVNNLIKEQKISARMHFWSKVSPGDAVRGLAWLEKGEIKLAKRYFPYVSETALLEHAFKLKEFKTAMSKLYYGSRIPK